MMQDFLINEVEDFGRSFSISCYGELDAGNVGTLKSTIDFSLGDKPLFLHIDYRGLTSVAWEGVEALLYARRKSQGQGTLCRISYDEPLRQLLEGAGYSTLEELEFSITC